MHTEGNTTGSSGSTDPIHSISNLIKNLWKRLPSWARGTFLPFIIFGLLLVILYFAMGRDMKGVVSSLDSLSVLAGTFTTILALTTWFSLQSLRKNDDTAPESAGDDAAILVIDLGMNITQNVISFCAGKEEFKQLLNGNDFQKPRAFEIINKDNSINGFYVDELIPGKRILHVTRSKPVDNSELQSLGSMIYSTFDKVDAALHENGIGTLYVFYAGMAAIPFFIGELFGNRYDVHIYHYQGGRSSGSGTPAGRTYYYCGRMNHLSYK
jgi:hypothetical protein